MMLLAADGVNVAQNVGFGIIATMMIFAALSVVTTKNVVHAALWLALVLAGMAAQYILAAAEFVAVSQVMVYIGAVMVLFLFGIMLTRAQIGKETGLNNSTWYTGIPVAVLLFGLLGWAVLDFATDEDAVSAYSGLNADGVIVDDRADALAETLAGPVAEAIEVDPDDAREAMTAAVTDLLGDDRTEVTQAVVAAAEGVIDNEEVEVSEQTLVEPISDAIERTGQTLTTQGISDGVLSIYLVPFFGMTFVLLAAAIGAIVLARKD